MIKSALFWLLRSMDHELATEWRVANGYIDICDKTTGTFYELEVNSTTKTKLRKQNKYKISGYEMIFIDCSKMELELAEIQKYLERFIVTD
jgi:hypothetical protein